ncbi:MAG: TIGR03790 family protein [Armatimonadetes bacterium]|nr:TIGR03790 family protein [Armatimonadota bacterium]
MLNKRHSFRRAAAVIALAAAVCALGGGTTTSSKETQQSKDASRVLIVINQASPDSVQVGSYYRNKRGIPKTNVVFINVRDSETIPIARYRSEIEAPVRTAIKALSKPIDFIVLTKGIPIRISGKPGYSVDGHLGGMDVNFRPKSENDSKIGRFANNPYYRKSEPFSSKKYGYYLVTRLDGYTLEDAKRLVDNSLAAKGDKGPFFFDTAANRRKGDYLTWQKKLTGAHNTLTKKGFDSRLEETAKFVAPQYALMGYASWGSNDGAYDKATYRRIKFKPGAICETFVSTSARTFKHTDKGQSVITDLIANGVTGIKGYVSEPFTFALADTEILFDRYTSGYNLAESFYMASAVIKWKDLVIGDPLCSPYAKSD